MRKKLIQKAVCFALAVTMLFGAMGISSFAERSDWDTNSGSSASLDEMRELLGLSSYDEYESTIDPAWWNKKVSEISIDVTNFIGEGSVVKDSEDCLKSEEADPDAWSQFGKDNWDNSVYLPNTNSDGTKAASTTWQVDISEEQTGLYYLQIEYYNCIITNSAYSKSSVSPIQRKFKIDGKVPFDEVGSITFDKHWVYDNVTESAPTDVKSTDKYQSVGTYVDYELVEKHKGNDSDKNGYFKHVTKVYKENGSLKKIVTTYKIAQDINGNSMSPTIEEQSVWSTYICKDGTGYHDGYFAFLFDEAKTYTITLEAERDPMIIKSIKLVPATDGDVSIPTFEEYLNSHSGAKDATGDLILIEAEFPVSVSDSSVIPSNDNSSYKNSPISSKAQLFNVIGETGYSAVGQWASYKFTVSESGMYNISMRFLQSTLQGMFVCRTIKLAGGEYGLADGSPSVPYVEAQYARFNYGDKWQSKTIGYYDEKGNETAFKFYFEAGVEYTLSVECSLGDLREYLERAETALNKINDCYLQILQRTGPEPDKNTDYKFKENMPGVLVTLGQMGKELEDISVSLKELCGGDTGAHIATLDTVVRLLYTMSSSNGRNIAQNLGNLKTYLGTLGTWINDSKQGVVMIDNICIVPVNTSNQLPRANANFFESLWFEILSFIYSFFTNYDQMGLTKEPTADSNSVSVWFASGRDQASIWRSMVDSDNGFSNIYNSAVNLKLVTGGTLLPSILSGDGPDVYMGLSSADTINYAIRSAVIGVSGNDTKVLNEDQNIVFRSYIYENADGDRVFVEPDGLGGNIYRKPSGSGYAKMTQNEIDRFNANIDSYRCVSLPYSEVEKSFAPAAVDTLELLEVYYGVPNTMNFAMMFYRMDVLGELGLEVPESWGELIAMLPVLQTKNMSIGVSYISALDFMMYQMGGNMWKYTDSSVYDPQYAGSKIDLDSDVAIEAFEFVCRLYTEYSFPVSYDAANRFRTGEMPIVIGSYESIYNTLVVYATEISGLWEFCPLPGSENENEEDGFNYDSLATVGATVILNGCDDLVTAWQFVQWQTSASVQAEYGNRIVAVIGPAAKYETANIQAVHDLSWTAREKAAIIDQMNNLNSIKNYPGSYIYSRYMKFAFLDAYNNGADPYEAMMSYIPTINDEIKRKRDEFGLKTAESAYEALLSTNNK